MGAIFIDFQDLFHHWLSFIPILNKQDHEDKLHLPIFSDSVCPDW